MVSEVYPGAGDERDLAAAHAVLAAQGVQAGVDGYDLAVLAAAVYAAGWSYRIDRATGMPGYEAEVQMGDGITRYRTVGWDPAVALAFALGTAFEARPK